MNYNLLEEKWIPVLWKNGNTNRMSVIEALTQASRIRQVAASNPMDRVAVLRFLLAILYWCKGNPPGVEDSLSIEPVDPWFAKLSENRDCFDLLGDGERFYQRKSDNVEKRLSANYLVQEIPTGTNFWHFRHSTDEEDGLCLACCAMGLLRLPMFATSGGRGKPPGVNQKPPIYVIPVGVSLHESLLLSWRQVGNLGRPSWEKPDQELPKKGQVPLLTGLTWVPRRVWLDNPEGTEATCISCGRKELLVRRSAFAGIGSTKTGEDGTGRVWIDPHIISDSKEVVRPSNVLGFHGAAAGQWASIAGGILEQQAIDARRIWVLGFATVQNDKYLEAMEYEITLRCAPGERNVQESIEKFETWRNEGSMLRRKVRPKASPRKGDVEIQSMIAAVRPQVEERVCANVGELIAGGENAWEQAASEYSPMIAAVAKSLYPGYTTAAVRGQRLIAEVKPNMGPDTKAARKKGGDK